MMRVVIKVTAVLIPLGPLVCGCRATPSVVDRAGRVQHRANRATALILAVHVEPARQRSPSRQAARWKKRKDEEKPAAPKPPPDNQGQPARHPPARAQAEQKPTEGKASREQLDKKPRPRLLPYTTPSAVAFLALDAFAKSGDEPVDERDGDQVYFAGGGRELAESSVGIEPTLGNVSFVGRPGLTAPRASVGGGLVGRPGLQDGPATLLGFAAMQNIFTPQMNLLSGPMGRCHDLSMAGFFGGSRAVCEANFVRR